MSSSIAKFFSFVYIMAAPKGNQFWKLRSKHGRDTLFANAELLWVAATEYFQWCDDHPLIEIDFRGKDASKVEMPKMRPYTLQGLCLYLDCGTAYFRNFIPPDDDFKSIITRIEETIYNQKFSGAAAGFLNPNIIARDLGLQDKQSHEHSGANGGPISFTNQIVMAGPELKRSEKDVQDE